MPTTTNPFGSRSTLSTAAGDVTVFRLNRLAELGIGHLDRLPFSVKVLLESALRNVDGFVVNESDVTGLAGWNAAAVNAVELPFKPARVILQDFTGVPCVVDLAAMRAAMKRGSAATRRRSTRWCRSTWSSTTACRWTSSAARWRCSENGQREFERNMERYEFLKWGQKAFANFSVVPPATGIVHQVNLEYLAKVVVTRDGVAFPDSASSGPTATRR